MFLYHLKLFLLMYGTAFYSNLEIVAILSSKISIIPMSLRIFKDKASVWACYIEHMNFENCSYFFQLSVHFFVCFLFLTLVSMLLVYIKCSIECMMSILLEI